LRLRSRLGSPLLEDELESAVVGHARIVRPGARIKTLP
jgi:hypothetical protein